MPEENDLIYSSKSALDDCNGYKFVLSYYLNNKGYCKKYLWFGSGNFSFKLSDYEDLNISKFFCKINDQNQTLSKKNKGLIVNEQKKKLIDLELESFQNMFYKKSNILLIWGFIKTIDLNNIYFYNKDIINLISLYYKDI